MKPEKKKMRKRKKHEFAFLILVVAMLISFSLASAYSAINCTVTVPAEKPDLAISPSDLLFSPTHPMIGDTVVITASVHNIGGANATDVTVNFYVDGNLIETGNIPLIHAFNETKNVSVLWTAAEIGFHDILVKIDENNSIEEINEGNNQAQKSIKVTKPLAISLTAEPETITANGTDTSTITAVLTDEFGRRVNGTEVAFSTSLGNFTSTNTNTASAVTTNGIANATLRSSTSPGTANVTGSATINYTFVNDFVHVAFLRTDVVVEPDTDTIDIEQEYESSDPDVGTIESQIGVELDKNFTDVRLEMTLADDPDFIDPELKDIIASELEAVFNLTGITASDAKNSTPVVIRAKLSAKNLTKEDVKEVRIEITVGKKWFADVAQGNVSNLRLFKINDTTGKVESEYVTKVAETTTNVTFLATYDHFSVFAIVAQPPSPAPPGPSGVSLALPGSTRPKEEEVTILIANPGINIFNFESLGLDITKVSIDLKTMSINAKVALEKTDKPAEVPYPSGIIYRYFDISTNLEPENIHSASINFRVRKSWTRINDVEVETIRMCRYATATGWEELETSKIKEDDDYFYFSTETSALSLFAISGEKKALEFATPTPSPISPIQPVESPTPSSTPAPSTPAPVPGMGWSIIIVAIVASAIIVSVAYLLLRRRKA